MKAYWKILFKSIQKIICNRHFHQAIDENYKIPEKFLDHVENCSQNEQITVHQHAMVFSVIEMSMVFFYSRYAMSLKIKASL